MNGISEGLAEMGQGVLAGHAIDPPSAAAADGHTHESACLNCGTALVGPHCHACGQAAHVHRTLGAFFHDLLHGVFHFEGRIWRTLPLLVLRPGRLTRAYIEGRRASYISPIALFLFFVFFMFAVFHATQGHSEGGAEAPGAQDMDQAAARIEADLGALRTQREALEARGGDTAELDARIEGQRTALSALRKVGQASSSISLGSDPHSDFAPVEKAIRKFKANPDLAAYKLQTYAYKYSWALIPISVPFIWLLFPFSRRFHLYDHTVFVTYSLSFMTLLAIVAMVAGAVGLSWLGGFLLLVPPFHMFAQLRGAYGLGFGGALWRTFALLLFASTALLIFFLMIMAQTTT